MGSSRRGGLSLALRIALSTVALVVAANALSLTVVYRWVQSDQESQQIERLQQGQAALASVRRQEAQLLRAAATAAAGEPLLLATLGNAETSDAALGIAASNAKRSTRADAVFLLDTAGRIRSATVEVEPDLLVGVLDRESSLFVVDGSPNLVVVSPSAVFGQVVGYLALGRTLDERFLAAVRDQSGVDCAVVSDGSVLLSLSEVLSPEAFLAFPLTETARGEVVKARLGQESVFATAVEMGSGLAAVLVRPGDTGDLPGGLLGAVGGVGAVTTLLTALVSLLLGYRLARPLQALTEAAGRVVTHDDLEHDILTTRNDEIGRLSRSFSSMMQKVRTMLSTMAELGATVGTAGSRLGASADAQTGMLTRQAAALQETQVTIEEIRQTSRLAASKMDQVLGATERAEEVRQEGEGSIEASREGLRIIQEHTDLVREQVLALDTSMSRLAEVADTVSGLADRSRMLALNATIEAVRSGAQGNAFAVVAREMRSLADLSVQSTQRVREIMDQVRSNSKDAVSYAEEGAEHVGMALAQLKTSEETLRSLSAIVTDNASSARQVAAAVQQQATGINQISLAVNDLSNMMDETMGQASDTQRAVVALRDASDRMAALAERRGD